MTNPYTSQQWKSARRKAAYAQVGGVLATTGGLSAMGAAAMARKRFGPSRLVGRLGPIGAGVAGAGMVGMMAASAIRKRANAKRLNSVFASLKDAPIPWDHKGRYGAQQVVRYTPSGRMQAINPQGKRLMADWQARRRALGYT